MTASSHNSDDNAADKPSSALGRWARRKADVERENTSDAVDAHDHDTGHELNPPAPDDHGDSGSPLATVDEAPLLSDADMPDVNSLAEGSDFSQFMSPGVSDALRKRALTRLFRLPVFGIRDGLDDYDDDFRAFIPLGDTVTSDMRFAERRLKERAQELLEQNEKAALAQQELDDQDTSDAKELADADALSEDGTEIDKIHKTPSAIEDHVDNRQAHEDDDMGEAEDDMV